MAAGIVAIRFTTRWPYNPASLVIARATGSRDWSHTMAVIDGRAYEATMGHGCRAVDLAVAMKGVARCQDMLVEVPDIEAAQAFGESQHGKPYDYAGALGLPFLASEDWQDDSRWWCSEHNFALLMAGGVNLLAPAEQKRVTPNVLFQANKQKLLPQILKFSKRYLQK